VSEFEVQSRDYQKAARALKGADREIRLGFTRALRGIAKPYAQTVLAAGAARLPKGGGLSARVAASRIGVQSSTLRATASFKSDRGYDLRAMNRGRLRHPTYGHTPWVTQEIEPGVFTAAFEAGAPLVRRQMLNAATEALNKIAEAT
jgi:hypothetical protein